MFEIKSGVLLIAGLTFFLIAFLSNAVLPILMVRDLPEKSVEELVNANVMYQFEDLSRRYAEPFAETFGEPTPESCAATECRSRPSSAISRNIRKTSTSSCGETKAMCSSAKRKADPTAAWACR